MTRHSQDSAATLELLELSNALHDSCNTLHDLGRDDLAELVRRCGEMIATQVYLEARKLEAARREEAVVS